MPTRFLHDCRRTAARTLIRASVPERVAMLLTWHTSRAICDRDHIIHKQELLETGELVAYLAQLASAAPARRRPHVADTAAPHSAPSLRLVRSSTAYWRTTISGCLSRRGSAITARTPPGPHSVAVILVR